MSDFSSGLHSSRGKVWFPLRFGEPLGKPFAEWGYRTPRFPMAIKESELASSTSEVQLETMIVWFLMNHTHAVDQIAGGGQRPFSNGGRAADFLWPEFRRPVPEATVLEAANFLDGLWEQIPAEFVVQMEKQKPEELQAALIAALDDFSKALRKPTADYGGIGHNRPPDDGPTITEEEKQIVLRATAETRLAVLSSDYRAASLAWEAISPIIKKIGNGVATQIANLCTKFASTLGVAAALMATGYIGYELGFWNKAEAISAMLEIAKHLPH
jgi:hypothetical protein